MARQRIEYIDAMRGFTMILVIFSHICNYCLGDRWMGFNDVFFLFRLPCFFFISGWLFCKADRRWDSVTIRDVVKRKFMVQIVPTFIFLLILAPPPMFFSRLGATKGGYWFTFALFEFFVIYILSARYFRKWEGAVALTVSVLSFCYDAFYHRWASDMGWLSSLLGFLSFSTWRYYLFFYFGIVVKRHFALFLQWIGKTEFFLLVVIVFALLTQIPHTNSLAQEYLVFAVGGLSGLTMVFAFFYRFSAAFTKEKLLGRSLQYVGTRTLDVYLLHYFFLPRFLLPHGELLRAYDCKLLEFSVASCLAVLVLMASLFASRIIRQSPLLARYLFGVQTKSN